jgi:hypothetical protein
MPLDFPQASETILSLLKKQGKATNSEMTAALGGDADLFTRVRESLILDDLAKDKKGVGLVYTGPPGDETTTVAEIPSGAPAPDPPADAAPRRVFISYGRKDAAPLAQRLLADLEARGHDVWLDTQQIGAGRSWEAQIEEAILESDVFISLLTPHAVRRPDGVCLDEISMARYSGRRIPTMLDRCDMLVAIWDG